MILYVNGDSHAAAAEAVNQHAFAEDDGQYFYMGRSPHPDNIAVSWGKRLSEIVKAVFHCQAESASSNQRIIRTAREWVANHQLDHPRTVMIIQWSTWERQEWLIDGTYYQINASGIDTVPDSHKEKYKQFVADIDWEQVTIQAHNEIWEFHKELESQNIKHVFFNGNNCFDKYVTDRRDWKESYIGPYDPAQTFDGWLKNNGFDTVSPNSWHYDKEAHTAWSRFMLQYCIANKLI